MKNPRPPGRPGPPVKPPSAAAAGPPPRKPPSSTPAVSTSGASTVPPSQKPPPATASTNKPPQSNKSKSRWESPSKAKPSPQTNRNDNSWNSKGGPSSASPSTSTIQRDQKAATAHPPPFPPHLPPQFPIPDPAAISLPPPPPPYGFQNLDRRTIVLFDGTVRTYFALPPEEPLPDPFGPDRHFPPPPHLNQFSPEGFREPPFVNRPPGHFPPFDGPSSGKRKFSEEDELARQRMHVLQYGNPNAIPNSLPTGHLGGDERDNPRGLKHARISGDGYDDMRRNRNLQPDNVDRRAVKKAFLKFVKMIYEDADLKRRYEDTRRNGPLHCNACGRLVIAH